MGMMLRLLNAVVGEIDYGIPMKSLYKETFDLPNGNLSPRTNWVHNPVTPRYNQVIDKELHGPDTDYAYDVVNVRIPHNRGYIRGRVTTPMSTLELGGQSRLNFKSGRSNTPMSDHSFQSFGIRAIASRLAFIGQPYLQGWNKVPSWANAYRGAANEYRVGDEFAVLWQGRTVFLYKNGEQVSYVLSDEAWTPGYFAGVMLDAGHSFSEIEIGYYGRDSWQEYGDNFGSSKLEQLWSLSPNKQLHIEHRIQASPSWATGNGVFYGWGHARQLTHEDDQIIRGSLKEPSGVSLGNNVGTYLLGRCGVDASETAPRVAFVVTPGNGAAISTMVGGTPTNRKVATASDVGVLTYPVEMELQCIGKRYFGLVNGKTVCEWNDTTNIVAIGPDRRSWGWVTSVVRSGSTYTYSPALDNVVANGTANIPIRAPILLGVNVTSSPLDGGGLIVVAGTDIPDSSQLFVGNKQCAELKRWSTNTIEGILPSYGEGVYDVKLVTPNGDSTLVGAITYSTAIAAPGGVQKKANQVITANSWTLANPMGPIPSVSGTTVMSGTSGLVVPATGAYTLEIAASFSTNFLGTRRVRCIRKNDGVVLFEKLNGAEIPSTQTINVNQEDVLELWALSDVSDTLYRTLAATSTYLKITPV